MQMVCRDSILSAITEENPEVLRHPSVAGMIGDLDQLQKHGGFRGVLAQ
jgi:hypothetical protein